MVLAVFKRIVSISDNFTHYFNDTFTDAKSVPGEGKRRKRREELETVLLSLYCLPELSPFYRRKIDYIIFPFDFIDIDSSYILPKVEL